MKFARFATVAAALALSTAAHAGEPFELGDAQMSAVTAGGVFEYAALTFVDVEINKVVFKQVDVFINVDANIDDLTATAEAYADASGSPNAFTQTDTFAQVDANAPLSQAGSLSFAAISFDANGSTVP